MLVVANIFQPLITVFESVLKFFHNTVGTGWGLSIVLLTVVIRLVLVPLTLKQFKSMQAMQRLQPQMKEIQAKYKDDKQRQQQEMMKFYKENNVNPLASCLPLVAQLPVFISLFYMLRKDLRDNICPSVQILYRHVNHLGPSATVACTKGPLGPHAPGAAHAGFLFINDLTNNATGADVGRADPALRRHAARLDDDDVLADDGPDAAEADDVHAADLRPVHHQLPGRRARLLDHDEHLDDGPAVHRQEAARTPGATGTGDSRRRANDRGAAWRWPQQRP